MRALWQFFLYLFTVILITGLAFLITFLTMDLILATLLLLIVGIPLGLLFTHLRKWIDTKMDTIEKRVDREQNEEFIAYETDPVSGMTYAISYKKHLLETQKAAELLPPSDALLIAVEIASSLQEGLARLSFEDTYGNNFNRFKTNNPELQLVACKKRLQEGLQQAFEQGDYWQKIEEQLEHQSLGNLINYTLDIKASVSKTSDYDFFLRDTPLEKAVLTEKYQQAQVLYESAILPVAKGNYPPITSHRFMFYHWPYLTDAQAFTQVPNTALLPSGFYQVADQFTFRDKTMILLCFVATEKEGNAAFIIDHSSDYYVRIITKARAHFQAAFELAPDDAFASEHWQELMKPLVGEAEV